jgi:hypothetical protein
MGGGTRPVFCPVAGLSITSVEPSVSATAVLLRS